MKIVIKTEKPRAKWLNDVLRSKRSEKHRDPSKKTRQQYKRELAQSLEA